MNKKIITAALLYVCSFSFSMWIQFSCLKQSHVIRVCILLAPDFCLFNHYFISFYMMIYCITLHHIVSYFLSCHNSFQISCSITLSFIKCLIISCYIILYIIPYYVVSYFMHHAWNRIISFYIRYFKFDVSQWTGYVHCK